MDIIRFSILKPVTVLAGIIMVLMFGIISLNRLPYQLSPTVIEPEIQITTTWRGASPYEVEREIIEEQEDTLKGLPDLIEMESESRNSFGSVTLRFKVGTSVEEALLRVSNKINEVPDYPNGVDNPVVNASGATASPVIWMILKTMEGNERPIQSYKTFFEDEVRQHIERVKGVSDLFIGSGTEEEMHIILTAEKLAVYGLTTNDVIAAIQGENINVSAGTLGVGRRDFRIRTTGEFNSAEDIAQVVLRSTGQQRVKLGDLAEIKPGFEKQNSIVLQNGVPGIAIGVRPEAGTNILEMTNLTEEKYFWLNEDKLKQKGCTSTGFTISVSTLTAPSTRSSRTSSTVACWRSACCCCFCAACAPPLSSPRQFRSVSSGPSFSSTCSAATSTSSLWRGSPSLSVCWSTTPSSSSKISTGTD